MAANTFPVASFYFEVKIDGVASTIQFQEVSGLKADIKYKNEPAGAGGGNSTDQHKVFDKIEHGPVTLKRGLVKDSTVAIKIMKDAFNIHLDHATTSQTLTPKTITITLFNEKAAPILVFGLDGAYPTVWEISSFDAMSKELSIETLQIEYRSLKIS